MSGIFRKSTFVSSNTPLHPTQLHSTENNNSIFTVLLQIFTQSLCLVTYDESSLSQRHTKTAYSGVCQSWHIPDSKLLDRSFIYLVQILVSLHQNNSFASQNVGCWQFYISLIIFKDGPLYFTFVNMEDTQENIKRIMANNSKARLVELGHSLL